ncbi:MAG TPA: type II toxin-antitoxin system prevent-host-death family antitoxin [Alphaproteobacteria bacterium]|nr:type II toxin-antitoxin system prevent-host-death family antitoxin [Alphaproteobacteria bacterium]
MGGTFEVCDAATQLPQLLARVEAGEVLTIARDGKPVARLVPVTTKGKRKFGAMRGKIAIGPAFFEPLSENELEAWRQ